MGSLSRLLRTFPRQPHVESTFDYFEAGLVTRFPLKLISLFQFCQYAMSLLTPLDQLHRF